MILLRALDAISQGTDKSNGNCSFSILKKKEYAGITDLQERHLKALFRNGLSHTATISPNCIITCDPTDKLEKPFSFEEDEENTLSKINLFFLQKLATKIWDDLKENFSPADLTSKDAKKYIPNMSILDFYYSNNYKELLLSETQMSKNLLNSTAVSASGVIYTDIDINSSGCLWISVHKYSIKKG